MVGRNVIWLACALPVVLALTSSETLSCFGDVCFTGDDGVGGNFLFSPSVVRQFTRLAQIVEWECHVHPVPPGLEGGQVTPGLRAALRKVDAALRAFYRNRDDGLYFSAAFGQDIIWSRGYGHVSTPANPVLHEPSRTGTMWPMASVTKVFTGLLLLQMRDRGLIRSVDAPVVDYLPEFSLRTPPGLPGLASGTITLRALGAHLGGMPREPPCAGPCNVTTSEVLARLSAYAPILPTYSRAAYSNLGLALLGRALEAAYNSGPAGSSEPRTYEELVTELTLIPLGMANATFDVAEVFNAVPSVIQDGGPMPVEAYQLLWNAPAGALVVTAADMEQFLTWFWSWTTDSPVLTGSSIREWTVPMRNFADAGLSGIGLPWEEYVLADYRVLTKGGDLPGFHSDLMIVPSLKLSLMFLSSNAGSQQALSFLVTKQLIEAMSDYAEAKRRRNYLPPGNVTAYTGTYEPRNVSSGAVLPDAPVLTLVVESSEGYDFLAFSGLPPPQPFLGYVSEEIQQLQGPGVATFRLFPRPDDLRPRVEICSVLADGIFYEYVYFNVSDGGYASSFAVPGLHPQTVWIRADLP